MIRLIKKDKVRNLDSFKYKYSLLFSFIRGVKIAFSASCFHNACAIIILTEVHIDILAGYKIWQLQLILGRFHTNQWGTERLRLMECGSFNNTYLYEIDSARNPSVCDKSLKLRTDVISVFNVSNFYWYMVTYKVTETCCFFFLSCNLL